MIGSTPHLTRIHDSEQDECIRQTYRGQAAWAGWQGPPDKACVDCSHFQSVAGVRREGYCALYRERMAKDTALRKFPTSAKACRDFVPRNHSKLKT